MKNGDFVLSRSSKIPQRGNFLNPSTEGNFRHGEEENSQIANMLTILSDINMSRSSCIIHAASLRQHLFGNIASATSLRQRHCQAALMGQAAEWQAQGKQEKKQGGVPGEGTKILRSVTKVPSRFE